MTLLPHLTLARPWWLLALLPLAFVLWHGVRGGAGTAGWRRAVDAHLLPHVLIDAPRSRSSYMLAAAWLLAVLALAGPVLDDVAGGREAARRDDLRVLVVELSPDAAPHLERIKLKLHALLSRPQGGEMALLVYADQPYLVVPPTGDAAVVARFIQELAVDAIPAAGNRPDRALQMAIALLERSSARTRDIIWFAAGDWNERALIPAGIRFSALHASSAATPILRENAERSDGILLAMRNDDTDLNTLADALTAGTRRAGTTIGMELGPWLLLPLLPLAALRFRRGLLAALPLLLCAGFLPESANAASLADMEGKRLFNAGRYTDAADRFTDVRWKAAAHYRAGRFDEAARLLEGREDPDSLYNRANALARMGRLQDALTGYEEALRIRPDDADTLHNRDLVRSLLHSPKSGGKSGNAPGPSASDANRVAEQWLRGVPDDPGTLLRRKLQAEHQRRLAGNAERPW